MLVWAIGAQPKIHPLEKQSHLHRPTSGHLPGDEELEPLQEKHWQARVCSPGQFFWNFEHSILTWMGDTLGDFVKDVNHTYGDGEPGSERPYFFGLLSGGKNTDNFLSIDRDAGMDLIIEIDR